MWAWLLARALVSWKLVVPASVVPMALPSRYTVYPVMGLPPSPAGASQSTSTVLVDSVAVRLAGASGTARDRVSAERLSMRKPLPALAGWAVPEERNRRESTVRVGLPSQSRK